MGGWERQIHRAGLEREPGAGAALYTERDLCLKGVKAGEGGQGKPRGRKLALELVWN